MLQPKQKQPLTDASGTRHTPVTAAPRIVSLVPSVTELVCDLGLARFLVGRTGFCVHPRDIVRRIPKVGGTKDVNVARIRELQPSHLIVNIDENEKPTVDALARVVPHIIVTHPLAPRDNLDLYRLLGGIFHCAERTTALGLQFMRVLDDVVAACRELPRQDVLYLIWRAPWMTVSRDTYISRTLALIGWDTLPAASDKRLTLEIFIASRSFGEHRESLFSLARRRNLRPLSNRATVFGLTEIPVLVSSDAILTVVLRVHFSSVIGSPAVSCFRSSWIREMISGVFFRPPFVRHPPAAGARARTRGAPVRGALCPRCRDQAREAQRQAHLRRGRS